MIYIPINTFFSLSARIGKCADQQQKAKLELELASLERLIYEGEAVIGMPQHLG